MSDGFKDFDLREPILRALDDAGYVEPTPIQREAVPILLGGSDLIGVAQTGTGKTLAYLLPILQNIEGEGDAPAAEVELIKAVELAPENKWTHYHLGEVYRQEGRVDEAKGMYEAALALDPDFEAARVRLAALKVGE